MPPKEPGCLRRSSKACYGLVAAPVVALLVVAGIQGLFASLGVLLLLPVVLAYAAGFWRWCSKPDTSSDPQPSVLVQVSGVVLVAALILLIGAMFNGTNVCADRVGEVHPSFQVHDCSIIDGPVASNVMPSQDGDTVYEFLVSNQDNEQYYFFRSFDTHEDQVMPGGTCCFQPDGGSDAPFSLPTNGTSAATAVHHVASFAVYLITGEIISVSLLIIVLSKLRAIAWRRRVREHEEVTPAPVAVSSAALGDDAEQPMSEKERKRLQKRREKEERKRAKAERDVMASASPSGEVFGSSDVVFAVTGDLKPGKPFSGLVTVPGVADDDLVRVKQCRFAVRTTYGRWYWSSDEGSSGWELDKRSFDVYSVAATVTSGSTVSNGYTAASAGIVVDFPALPADLPTPKRFEQLVVREEGSRASWIQTVWVVHVCIGCSAKKDLVLMHGPLRPNKPIAIRTAAQRDRLSSEFMRMHHNTIERPIDALMRSHRAYFSLCCFGAKDVGVTSINLQLDQRWHTIGAGSTVSLPVRVRVDNTACSMQVTPRVSVQCIATCWKPGLSKKLGAFEVDVFACSLGPVAAGDTADQVAEIRLRDVPVAAATSDRYDCSVLDLIGVRWFIRGKLQFADTSHAVKDVSVIHDGTDGKAARSSGCMDLCCVPHGTQRRRERTALLQELEADDWRWSTELFMQAPSGPQDLSVLQNSNDILAGVTGNVSVRDYASSARDQDAGEASVPPQPRTTRRRRSSSRSASPPALSGSVDDAGAVVPVAPVDHHQEDPQLDAVDL